MRKREDARLSNAARECNYSSRASNCRRALVQQILVCTCARTLPRRAIYGRGKVAEHPAAHSLFNTALDDSVTNLWDEARSADVKICCVFFWMAFLHSITQLRCDARWPIQIIVSFYWNPWIGTSRTRKHRFGLLKCVILVKKPTRKKLLFFNLPRQY